MTLSLKYSHFLLVMLLGLGFVACNEDDDTPPPTPATVAAVVTNDDRFDVLEDQLIAADLVTTLSGTGQSFTVFAPTDDAFGQVDLSGLTTAQIREILLYHVAGGTITAAGIAEGTSFLTNGNTLGPNDQEVVLLINKSGSSVMINGAMVTDADITAQNGVVHAINQVLLPPTVVDLAVAFPGTSSLVSALQAADASPDYDLVNTLSGDGPFTVFAPTNDVFMVPDGLTASQIGAVLAYHVIPGNVRAADLPDGQSQQVTTVNGATLDVIRNGNTVTLTDGTGATFTVTNADIQGANGVIHTIDGVMMPN